AYGGIGLAIALAYARSFVYGYSEEHWNQPNKPFLVTSFVVLFFMIIGARAVFALPVTLACNWVFRVTAIHRPAAYFAAVRESLLALIAVPIWITSAVLYFSVWPGRAALEH